MKWAERNSATVPFAMLDFNVDAFNDMITGRVSGKYSGPARLGILDKNFRETVRTVNAVNGIFSLSYPIDQNTFNVNTVIEFEG